MADCWCLFCAPATHNGCGFWTSGNILCRVWGKEVPFSAPLYRNGYKISVIFICEEEEIYVKHLISDLFTLDRQQDELFNNPSYFLSTQTAIATHSVKMSSLSSHWPSYHGYFWHLHYALCAMGILPLTLIARRSTCHLWIQTFQRRHSQHKSLVAQFDSNHKHLSQNSSLSSGGPAHLSPKSWPLLTANFLNAFRFHFI